MVITPVTPLWQILLQTAPQHSIWLRTICLLLVLVCVQAQATTLTAQVDRQTITEEETLNLVVRYGEQVAFGKPDFNLLTADFDILSNSQSNQYRSINGQVESYTQWRLMLAPKRTGQLTIPALAFKGTTSPAINIRVEPASSSSSHANTDKPVFIDAQVDKKQLFVQEQLLYTVRLITSVNLQGLNGDELKISGAVVKQVGENQYQRRIGGRNHLVIENVYAIFPQASGELRIPRLNYSVTMEDRHQDPFGRDPFFNRGGKRLRLHAPEKIIPVMPQPSNFSANTWLPASELNITQSWSSPPESFTVGEPITRTITLTAQGLSAAQLPPLTINEQSGIKYYPDQPQTEDKISNEGVAGIRTESYAIVPTRPGNFTLPSVVVSWWDTQANRIREVSLPVQTIIVAPAEGDNTIYNTDDSIDTSPQQPEASQSSFGSVGSFFLACSIVLNIILLALLWWRWRQPNGATILSPTLVASNGKSEKQAFNHLKACAKTHQPQQVRQALIDWAQKFWQQPGICSLNQVIGLSKSPALQASTAELDAALYQGDSIKAWNANNLLMAVEQERKESKPVSADVNDNSLPDLY